MAAHKATVSKAFKRHRSEEATEADIIRKTKIVGFQVLLLDLALDQVHLRTSLGPLNAVEAAISATCNGLLQARVVVVVPIVQMSQLIKTTSLKPRVRSHTNRR